MIRSSSDVRVVQDLGIHSSLDVQIDDALAVGWSSDVQVNNTLVILMTKIAFVSFWVKDCVQHLSVGLQSNLVVLLIDS